VNLVKTLNVTQNVVAKHSLRLILNQAIQTLFFTSLVIQLHALLILKMSVLKEETFKHKFRA